MCMGRTVMDADMLLVKCVSVIEADQDQNTKGDRHEAQTR
jgi:hypothetical protein